MRHDIGRASASLLAALVLTAGALADDPKVSQDKKETKPPAVQGGKTGNVGSLPSRDNRAALKQDRLGKTAGGAALGKEGAAARDALGGPRGGANRPETGKFGQLGQGGARDTVGAGSTKPDPRAFGRQRGQSDGLDTILPKQGRTGGDADRYRNRFGAPDPRDVGGLAGDGEDGDGPNTSTWTRTEDGKIYSRSVTISQDGTTASLHVRYDAPNGEHEEVTEVRRDTDGNGTFDSLVSRHVVDRDADGSTETQTVHRTDAGLYRLSVTRSREGRTGSYTETIRTEPDHKGILENIDRNVDPDSPYYANGKAGPDGEAWLTFRSSRPGTRGRPDDRAANTPGLRGDRMGNVVNPGPYQERGGAQNRGARSQDGGKLVNPGGKRSGSGKP